MKAEQLSRYLAFAIKNNFPVLIKGKPGIGKSDIVETAAKLAGADLILSHPVVSDPLDYKGLPFPSKDGTSADFLPYGDLNKIKIAKKKTVFFLDDLGQAPASVQAACMQLLLARCINGHAVSDHVTFIAATNRREDMAGVAGILEPVKSRFMSILDLEIDSEDWLKWANTHDMPAELTAFVRFMPQILDGGAPTRDIVNNACPRTIAHVGIQQSAGLPEEMFEAVFTGAAGPAFSRQYKAFLDMAAKLPTIESIIKDPQNAIVSKEPSVIYAITGGLAKKMTDTNIDPICQYLDRLKPEFSVACMTDATNRNPNLCKNKAFITWGGKYRKLLAAA